MDGKLRIFLFILFIGIGATITLFMGVSVYKLINNSNGFGLENIYPDVFSQGSNAVEFYPPINNNYNSETKTMTDSNGMTFKTETNGVVTINDERYIAFGLKGTVGGTNYTYTTLDYNWTWHVEQTGDDYLFWAENNDPQIIWKQYFYFYEGSKPMKIEHYLKNNLAQDITNTQMFYLMSVDDADSIEYNSTRYLVSDIKPMNIKKDLTDAEAVINLDKSYDFRFQDMVDEGFEINQFYIGDASFLDRPNIDIVAVGFTKNNGLFPAGAEILIDPEFSTNDIEGIDLISVGNRTMLLVACDEVTDRVISRRFDINGTLLASGNLDLDVQECTAFSNEVSAAAFNSTLYAVSYIDRQLSDIAFSILKEDLTTVVNAQDVDTTGGGIGAGTDVATFDSTNFVISWIDDLNGDATFQILNRTGGNLTGVIDVDMDVGTSAFSISVSTFNSSAFIIAWHDESTDLEIQAQIFDIAGNNLTGVLSAGVVGGVSSSLSTAVLDGTNFVIGWIDDGDDDASIKLYNITGGNLTGVIDVDETAGTNLGTPISISRLNDTAFYVAWYDGIDGDYTFAIYDVNGNVTQAAQDIETGITTTNPFSIAIASSRFNSETPFCNENFVVAYSNATNSASFRAFQSDGTPWNGTCVAAPAGGPADTIIPNVTIHNPTNIIYNTTIILFNVTADDDTAVTSCSYSLNGGEDNFTMANEVGKIWNASNGTVSQGDQTVTFSCEDAIPNINNSESVSFRVDSIQPAIQFVTPTEPNNTIQTSTTVTINYTTSDVNNTYSFVDINNDILAWFNFDTNSSGDPQDKSIHNNNCTALGLTSQIDKGEFGKAFNFPGNAPDWVTCGNDNSLDFGTNDFTLSSWVNVSDNDDWQLVIMKGNQSIGPNIKFGIYGTAYTPAVLLEDLDEIIDLQSNLTITEGNWHHIAATKNSTEMIIYVDGIKTGNISVATIGNLEDSNTLGLGGHLSDPSWWHGELDEVIIMNRSLEASEIRALFNSTIESRDYPNVARKKSQFTAYSTDLAGNINKTTRTIEVLNPFNVSLKHVDFQISDLIFDTSSYITAQNVSFNLTSPLSIISVKGVGQLRKATNAASSTVAMRLSVNDMVLFDGDMRTVSNLNDRGVFNIPLNSTTGIAGKNDLVLEVKESGSGSVNLSSFEIHMDVDDTSNETNINSTVDRYQGSFSNVSFVNLQNFTFEKSKFPSKTQVDITHSLVKVSVQPSTVRCYLQNNITGEVTPTYYRHLSGVQDVGSSGISYISQTETTNTETWKLFCGSDDTDTVDNNVTAFLFELLDERANPIGSFQNSTEVSGLTGFGNLLVSFNYTMQTSDSLELSSTVIMQSASSTQSGDDSPFFKINSTQIDETTCSEGYQRSLSGGSDIGTAKIYLHCTGSMTKGESYQFNVWTNVQPGETLNVLNVSFNGYETTQLNTTQGIVPQTIIISYPSDEDTVTGIIGINASIGDASDLGWVSNITLTNRADAFIISILDEADAQNTSDINFDTSTVAEGLYKINWTITSSAGTKFDRINITIDNSDPAIFIVTPTNGTNTSEYKINVNFTVSDSTLQACWWTSDFGLNNNSLVCGNNVTSVNWLEGPNTVIVYANDSLNNINFSAVSFTLLNGSLPALHTLQIWRNASSGDNVSSVDTNGNWQVAGDMNIHGVINNNLSHMNGISTGVLSVPSGGVWNNISLNQTFISIHGFTLGADGITYTVPRNGYYSLNLGMGIKDSSATPDAHVAMRITKNDAELRGSYVETRTVDQNSTVWLEHTTFALLLVGDDLMLQYISDDTTVTIEQQSTYGAQGYGASAYFQEIIFGAV